MQRRLPRTVLAILLTTLATLGGSQALAHDDPGSTQGVVPIPNYTFTGEAFLSIPILGPPMGGEEVLHSTLDLTWTTPSGGTLASDIVIEIDIPLVSGTATWVVHGYEIGWPAAYGTFSASMDTDAFNGVLAGTSGFPTAFHMHIGSQTGSTFGKFVDSTLTLELAGDVCQTDLGFGGPGSVSLSICGEALAAGGTATLSLEGAPAFAPVFLAVGVNLGPTPFKGGTLVPVPLLLTLPFVADGSGGLVLPVPGGSGPLTVYLQAVVSDGGQPLGYALSNALQVELLP
ncbi:MAG: hypothetical protein ACYTG2_13805 [Planctomycetota bacterium]|jgi:hypothetical protein